MGDARRAPFEERKAVAIAKQKAESKRKAEIRAKTEAAKTPEQKLAGKYTPLELMMMLGVSGYHQLPTLSSLNLNNKYLIKRGNKP